MATLQPMAEELALRLWESGHADPDWPVSHGQAADFLRLVNSYEAAELLHDGEMRVVFHDGRPAGFVTINVIPEHWLAATEVGAVECGTYLLPQFRGRGVNSHVKRLTLQTAFERFAANWCVFIVPVINIRAQRAFAKLPGSWKVSTLSSGERFKKYLKRKVWESGEDSVAYYIHGIKTH